MNSRMNSGPARMVLAAGVLCLAIVPASRAQVKTSTETITHEATVDTSVERAEVIAVQGNDLIVKMQDGSIRHLSNIPDSARVLVDGKELGIHDLQPGMKLQRTVKVTTTPKTIITTKTVTGKVWHVTPPNSVILTLEDGKNQKFEIPQNQKFNVNGQMVDAWGLKKGMNVTATKVVEEPVTDVERQKQVTGQMPPPPPPPPANQPIVVAVLQVPVAPATPEPPSQLPKTGTMLPLVGLIGFLSLVLSVAFRVARPRI